VELEIHTSSALKSLSVVATSNVFMIKGDTLHTHPADSYILSGITRDLALESALALVMTKFSSSKKYDNQSVSKSSRRSIIF
jgi:branched-subunit amino acid aminotransferase/4-amino-4-deoxychorismate lyase